MSFRITSPHLCQGWFSVLKHMVTDYGHLLLQMHLKKVLVTMHRHLSWSHQRKLDVVFSSSKFSSMWSINFHVRDLTWYV